MKTRSRLLIGALLFAAGCGVAYAAATDTNFKGRLLVQSGNTPPTCATASGVGDICASDDIEANGDLDVAGTSTLTGAITATGDLACNGGAGALDFSGSGASSVLVADNDTTALLIGSTGQLDLITIDSGNDTETVLITGTTAVKAFDVGTGTASFAEPATFLDAITLSDGATIDQSANNVVTIAENSENLEVTFSANLATIASTTGATVAITPATAIAGVLSGSGTAAWGSVVAGADTACNTTCTSPCLAGFATGGTLVACTDATADTCICFGAN